MVAVRYVLPGLLIVLGILWPVNPDGLGVELFSMLVGAGLSVLLLNWLFRFGAKGDQARKVEADARDYYSEHGTGPTSSAESSRP